MLSRLRSQPAGTTRSLSKIKHFNLFVLQLVIRRLRLNGHTTVVWLVKTKLAITNMCPCWPSKISTTSKRELTFVLQVIRQVAQHILFKSKSAQHQGSGMKDPFTLMPLILTWLLSKLCQDKEYSPMPLILTPPYLDRMPLILTRFLKFCQDKGHFSIGNAPYLDKNAPYLDKVLKASVSR